MFGKDVYSNEKEKNTLRTLMLSAWIIISAAAFVWIYNKKGLDK